MWIKQKNSQADVCQQPELSDDSRKKHLLKHFLFWGAIITGSFSVANIFIFDLFLLAIIEFFVSAYCIWAFYFFRKTDNYILTAWLTVFMTALVVLATPLTLKGVQNSFIWVSLFPLIAFYLLGTKRGLIAHILFSSVAIAIAVYGLLNWTDNIGVETLANLTGILVTCGAFVFFYEYTKDEAFRHIHTISRTDELTRAWNRKMFNEVLAREVSYSIRYKRPLSLIMTDIDFFKSINDNSGHGEGDNILVEFTSLLQKHIRSSDSLSRWGGDEFVIILPNQNAQNAQLLADKLRGLVEKQLFKKAGTITSSFGVTEFRLNESVDTLIGRLDSALYQAKAQGRNKVISI